MTDTMVRTATWENIGTEISNAKDIQDVLKQAGLDYEVHKELVTLESGLVVPNVMATVKDNGTPIGIVSNNYEICQNRDAFDFINYINDDLTLEKAGETHTGLVYIIASLPELNILGDAFKPYVLFQNSHNGRYTIKACIAPLRIVCQNQLAVTFKNTANTINIKHNGLLNYKLENATNVMESTVAYLNDLNEQAEHYAGIKLSNSQLTKVIEQFFPIKDDMTDRQKNSILLNRNEFMRAYNEEDNRNFRGTVWSAINAYSDYITHRPVKNTKNSDENQFMAVTFAPNFTKFLTIVNSVAA